LQSIFRKRAAAVLVILILLVSACLVPLSVASAPDEGGRVPYQFSVDDLNGKGVGGTMIGVIRDLHLPLGQSITAAGWMATGEGVSAYQYLWVPTGGGYAEWKTVENVTITARGDLAAAGIPYASGHGSAGFSLTLEPPEDLAEGVYDVYIRAIDGMGIPCDMVALLNLRYGDPDVDDGNKHAISFPRIMREGETALAGKASVSPEGIILHEDGRVRLGELNLAAYAQMRITYTAVHADTGVGEGRKPILGLKSSGKHSYGIAGGAYNITDNLMYAALDPATGAGVLEVDLTNVKYYGDVWLTGYLGGKVTITGIEFVYHGYVTDRVAAKIHLSEELVDYFSGYNFTNTLGISDPILGDVLRLEVKEETNDPFVFFNAGKLMSENEIILDADEYKYMVFLYRAHENINSDRMNLYLCSGPITGATEACNQGVTLQRDGQWHYLLVDLSQKENWGGIINGWRFDYVSAQSDPGDAVDFASVQFFRTLDGASQAASQDPLGQQPYHRGDPAVLRDMSEEGNAEKENFVIPDEDSFTVTEPETASPAASEPSEPSVTTEPEETQPPVGESGPSAETAQPPKPKGCASVLMPLTGILAVAAFSVLVKKEYKGEL
jgi:hypothetical protein